MASLDRLCEVHFSFTSLPKRFMWCHWLQRGICSLLQREPSPPPLLQPFCSRLFLYFPCTSFAASFILVWIKSLPGILIQNDFQKKSHMLHAKRTIKESLLDYSRVRCREHGVRLLLHVCRTSLIMVILAPTALFLSCSSSASSEQSVY